MRIGIILGVSSFIFSGFATNSADQRHTFEKDDYGLNRDSVFVIQRDSFHFLSIEKDSASNDLIYSKNVAFWKKDILLSADSFLVVNQHDREVFDVVHKNSVHKIEKGKNLTSLGRIYAFKYDVPQNIKIKFVRGRKDFFNYSVIGPKLKEAHRVFLQVGADPIIAQLLLLIESPNNHKGVSHSGAAGHFQIMPSVARKYGLRVGGKYDERHNFVRSSYAAARLVKEYCVPQAKRILTQNNITIEEDALWFKLVVLHIYNAGAGTVSRAVRHLDHVENGNQLIKTLWKTNVGAFQNSSQNYTQVCLASYLGYKEYLTQHLSK